jgi:CRISPR-associated protein Csx10
MEPVLANTLGGEPNSANSLYYIPGGLLRGAAINAYSKTRNAGDDTFRRLFLDGSTRFLNAYPVSSNGRSLPLPVQYKKPKYFDASSFGNVVGGKIVALEEELQINVHTQRDAELGHATTARGAVYRYIALPARMKFEGAVLTASQADADEIEALLKNKPILLGKARTAGYGHAEIQTGKLEGWSEGNPSAKPNGTITLTFVSPAIIRDPYGQASLDIQLALQARLGVDVSIIRSFHRAEVVGGFNRTWGLPLPQTLAIAAGSVFEIKANASSESLQKLEETGLGERRAEGFGRIAINLDMPETVKDEDWSSIPPEFKRLPAKQINLSHDPTALLILRRLGRKDLDERVLHAAREITEGYKGNVPNSQLSRWRVIVRNVLDTHDIPRLMKFRDESKGKPGWKKMEKARVKSKEAHPRLTEWIDAMLDQPMDLYPALGIEASYARSLGANTFSITEDLNREYRLRLIDTVLAVMAKMNGDRNE